MSEEKYVYKRGDSGLPAAAKPPENLPPKLPEAKNTAKTVKTNKRGRLWLVLLLACLVVFAVSAGVLVSYWLQYRAAQVAYDDIYAVAAPAAASGAGNGDFIFSEDIDFDALAKMNPDIAAWLQQPGTKINYPVVHGADNVYYLTHLFDGTSNPSGTLFIDSGNQPGFAGKNTIIYGHNMLDGTMFSSLERYQKQDYYAAHPTMQLTTPEGGCTVEIFAAFRASVEEDAWRTGFADDGDFAGWAAWLAAKSAIATDVEVAPGDRVITLSTCVNNDDDARFLVYGRLAETGAAQ